MGLFDSLQNMLGGATDAAQGSLQDVVGGLADNQMVQEAQEHITNATDIAGSVAEQGHATIEDITNGLL